MNIIKNQSMVRTLICFLVLLWICHTVNAAEIPDWWHTCGIINTQVPPSDYSIVNQGQLKHVAYQTWVEMTNQLAQVATNAHEIDPTVLASVKDGVSWEEISNRPPAVGEGVHTNHVGDVSIDGRLMVGSDTVATGYRTTAFGKDTLASAWASHAEGGGTRATGTSDILICGKLRCPQIWSSNRSF